jgi:hypothetical protein
MARTVVKELLARFKGDTKDLDQASQRANKSLESVKKAAKLASVALTATGVATIALASRQAKLIDQTAKTSDKLGITTEALIALRFAAEESGVASNTLDMALQRMTRRLSEAAMGTGEAKDALKELGLDARQLSEASPDEAFRQIADAMANVNNQSDRVRLAFKLFDSEGVALVNTLKQGGDALREYSREAQELGISLSRIDASQVEQANDAFGRAGKVIAGVGNQIAVEFAPLVTILSNSFVDAGKAGQDELGYKLSGALKVTAGAIDVINRGVQLMRVVFASNVTTIIEGMAKASRVLVRFGEAVSDVVGLVGIDREVNSGLVKMTEDLEGAAIEGRKEVSKLVQEIQNYESTIDRIEKLRRKKPELQLPRETEQGRSLLPVDIKSTNEAKNAVNVFGDNIRDVKIEMEELNRAGVDAFSNIRLEGIRSFDDVKNVALEALSEIAQKAISVAFGGSMGSSGGIGDILGNALGGAVGGLFGGGASLSSSATGLASQGSLFNIPAFAGGGAMNVGGTGGTDSQLVAFRATPNERITVEKPSQNLRQGKQSNITINQTIEYNSTNIPSAVQLELAKALPAIEAQTLSAVKDAQERGSL